MLWHVTAPVDEALALDPVEVAVPDDAEEAAEVAVPDTDDAAEVTD